jgi:hypothetical protein
LLGLIYDPVDGGEVFLRSFYLLSRVYTVFIPEARNLSLLWIYVNNLIIVNYIIGYTRLSEDFFFFIVAPTLGSLLPLLENRAEFPQFLDQGQSVALLGRVISSSQGLYLYTKTEKRTHIHKH